MSEQIRKCRRCLLEQAGEPDLAKAINERIEQIPEEKRASAEEYARRLAVCRECEHLISGTCTKCGCYVQLRAARKDSECPHEKKLWRTE